MTSDMTSDVTSYDIRDHRAMLSATTGHFVSQAARTLAELRVPDLLHGTPRSAEEIAESVGTHPDATFRLLRCAVFLGFLTHDDATGRFATTALLDRLRTDAPDSLRNTAIMSSSPGHWGLWGLLPDVVRTGTEQSALAHGRSIWEYYAEHPDEADRFTRGMTELSAPIIREAVAAIDAKPGDTIVDLGGATGAFVLSMLERHPGTNGIVVDLPHSTDAARREIARRNLTGRCAARPGDFFAAVPPADLYLVKSILHDWDDDACVRLLARCREAMNEGGRVVVVDIVIGPTSRPGPAALLDLNMLVKHPGREHDLADFDRIFASAGLRRARTTALNGPYHAIEAVPA